MDKNTIEDAANSVRAKLHKSPLMIFLAVGMAIVVLDVIVTYVG